jgi:hypothetical protein
MLGYLLLCLGRQIDSARFQWLYRMARLETPFGHRLQAELANEFSRMDSEWFFPWHGLNSGREIDLDRFDGRRIRLGGVLYDGCAEREIRVSGEAKASAIAEDAANVAEEYCNRIRRQAIDTDRRLKGRGNPDTQYSSPYADRMEFTGEIARRKAALANFYKSVEPSLTSEGAAI